MKITGKNMIGYALLVIVLTVIVAVGIQIYNNYQ